MAQKSSDNKKIDFSNLPRGAIGIKGFPVSRNTRLPSIRSPRDLTLGGPPKRTFMPNIPAKREKKPVVSENNSVQVKQENDIKNEVNDVSLQTERGHGRVKRAVIQTSGIFSEGPAGSSLPRRDKVRESYHRSDFVSVRGTHTHIKKEKEDTECNSKLDDLYTDDFIDDGDDDVVILTKPTIFPNKEKKEATSEVPESVANVPKKFDQDIAKEVGFDVNRVAQFIKKEKGEETEEVQAHVDTQVVQDGLSKLLLNGNLNEPQLLLLQFPECVTVSNKMDYSQSESSQQAQMGVDSKLGKDQKLSSNSISSLPEGTVGKLQIMKSGKTRLVVGSLNFDLGAISHLESKHEVVSIKTESNCGDLNVLGYVKDKLIFDPDIDNLLM